MVEGQLDEPSVAPPGPAADQGDGAVAAVPAAVSGRDRRADDDPGTRWVAVLLAAAAAVAAILALRVTYLSDEAGGAWQSAVRTELQRAAVLLMEVRQVYGTEGEEAFEITVHEVLAERMEARAQTAPAEIAQTLEAEKRVHDDLVEQVKPFTELTADEYELPGGGYDLVARLVDYREALPDVLALDPDAFMQQGDRASGHARGVVSAGVPVAVAVVAGSLAMPYRHRRRLLLIIGWLGIAVGLLIAIALELTA